MEDRRTADLVVGTSAGSVAGAMITGGDDPDDDRTVVVVKILAPAATAP